MSEVQKKDPEFRQRMFQQERMKFLSEPCELAGLPDPGLIDGNQRESHAKDDSRTVKSMPTNASNCAEIRKPFFALLVENCFGRY